jgi:hypothetical protein
VKRGDLVTVVTSGDYGKPRPALIVQSDTYAEHPSITVLPLTSELHDMPLLRVTVEPSESTGATVALPGHGGQGDHHPARQSRHPNRPAGRGHAGECESGLGRVLGSWLSGGASPTTKLAAFVRGSAPAELHGESLPGSRCRASEVGRDHVFPCRLYSLLPEPCVRCVTFGGEGAQAVPAPASDLIGLAYSLEFILLVSSHVSRFNDSGTSGIRRCR